MTIPESQGGKTEGREIKADHWKMLHHPEEFNLSRAQQAVLAERYGEEDWQDEEAEHFYEEIIDQLDAHPGEFVASLIRYSHGTAIDHLLPREDKPLSYSRNIVGAVTFLEPEDADISDKVSYWKHFPYSFSSFQPSGEGAINFQPITHRTHGINLTHIRKNTNDGTNKPEQSRIIIGNDSILEAMTQLDRRQAISVQCGFMLMSEALEIEVPILGDLGLEMGELHEYWQKRIDNTQALIDNNKIQLRKLKVFASGLLATRLEIAEDILDLEPQPHTQAFSIQDSRTWPYMDIGGTDSIESYTNSIEGTLHSEIKELEERQMPLARLYLNSLKRYQDFVN